MYILNFIIRLFQETGRTATSACRSSLRTEEGEPLVAMDEQGREYTGRRGSTAARRQSGIVLGLTSEYKTFWETRQATRQCLIFLSLYILLAVLGYSYIFENWPISDSIYFAAVIFTTVGYGDLSPTNDMSRIFTITFALYGIVILGIFLGFVGEFIIQKQEENIQNRLANCRVKVMEQFSTEDSGEPPVKRSFANDLWVICRAELPIVLLLISIAAPIIYLEEWWEDPILGVYWMFITGSTIGFGDLGPTQALTRVLCILWIPLSVAVMGEILGRVAGAYIERRNDEVEETFMKRAMTLGDLDAMDTDRDGEVSSGEFLSYMLVAMQKVDKEDIDEVMDLFRKLDKSKTGVISTADLKDQYQLNVQPGITVSAATNEITLEKKEL